MWTEHGPFIMWLIKRMKPERIVEVGNYSDYFRFAARHAAREVSAFPEYFAVNIRDDDDVSNHDDASTAAEITDAHCAPIHLSGEEALNRIADGSVDFLYLDALELHHRVSEAIRLWAPKLSATSVVLLNNMSTGGRAKTVYKVWSQLCDGKPHLDFKHGHGLGVLFWGQTIPEGVRELAVMSRDDSAACAVRGYFETVGEALSLRQRLDFEIAHLRDELSRQYRDMNGLMAAAQALEASANKLVNDKWWRRTRHFRRWSNSLRKRRKLPIRIWPKRFELGNFLDPNLQIAQYRGTDVANLAVRVIREPKDLEGQENVLFVTYHSEPVLKEHTRRYLAELKASGMNVILIVVMDDITTPVSNINPSLYDGLILRQNHGFDFSAWAHALKLWPDLWGSKLLILANDSVFGPLSQDRFGKIMAKVRASEADCIGLTDSYERYGWHLQSYFLAFKSRSLNSVPHLAFWENVRSCDLKQAVIDQYELILTPQLRTHGITCEALFPIHEITEETECNTTLNHWKELLERGFPFVKVRALQHLSPQVGTGGWRETIAKTGYDPQIIDRYMNGNEVYGGNIGTGIDPEHPGGHEPRALRSPLKVAFIGPWNYSSGLGSGARGYISALWRTPFLLNLHPIHRPFHVHGKTAPYTDVRDFEGPADICIINLNPDAWPSLIDERLRRIINNAGRRIGLWVWEMEQAPSDWLPTFGEIDEIWTPSHYCKGAFEAASDKPVRVVPHVVNVNRIQPVSSEIRKKLGLPKDRPLILYSFDGASYLIRKNPFALVRAFAASNLAQKGWSLVLKTKNLYDHPEQGSQLDRLVDDADEVYLRNQNLSKGDNVALFDACKIYASPHSSEGFGLTIAEAMAAGKIVVATDYGGPRDFLDATCGFPVSWKKMKLDRDHGHYANGGVWARVDEAALAKALEAAADAALDPAQHLGTAAMQRIRNQLSREAVGGIIETFLREKIDETT